LIDAHSESQHREQENSMFSAAVLAASILGAPADAPAAKSERKPNILVIVADDLGYGDLGFQGGKDIPTPNLDALQKRSVQCSSGYVSGPYCSPTRAGLLSGRYQQRFGHEFNPGTPVDGKPVGLDLSQKTIADRLKAAGYKTALVGKWHLGNGEKFRPNQRGFDEFFGFLGGAHDYFKQGAGPNSLLRNNEPIPAEGYLTDALEREAVAFIDRNTKSPFFLYLAFNAVHTPMQARPEDESKFGSIQDETRRTYAAMLSRMDHTIGKVFEKLNAAGLVNDTLVFFISDNGGPPGNGSSNGPLHGVKATTWEGGVRVPFLVSRPGKLPEGTKYDHPVIQLDILPTALAAAGVETKDAKLDGVDLAPHLSGKNAAPPHDALYWRFGAQWAVRSGDWKLVKAAERRRNNRNEFENPTPATLEGAKLFNLANDLGETKDLAAENPLKVAELSAKWKDWNKDLVAPSWTPSRQAGAKKKKKDG
jgi:arylsulfatase A-like enzyme